METNDPLNSSANPIKQTNPDKPSRTKLKKEAVIGLILLAVVGVIIVLTWHRPVKNLSAQPGQNTGTQDQIYTNGDVSQIQQPNLIDAANLKFSYKENIPPASQVSNYTAVQQKYGVSLSATQEKFLNDNKFLLVNLDKTSFTHGINFDDMLKDFDSMGGGNILNRKPEDTKLVTPDIVLHAYHKYFELTLEQLEQNELTLTLGDFITQLHNNLAYAVKNNAGTVKERFQNLEAQIVLGRVLFENKSPLKPNFFQSRDEENAYIQTDQTIDSFDNARKILAKYSSDLPSDLVNKIQFDLGKIYEAKEISVSPLFGQYSDTVKTDYTQFTPRSHYAKNSTLRAYFRTMMYFGRSSYFLKNDIGIEDASLLAKQFPVSSWQKIMDITGFYAGQSDDLTYTQWQEYLSKILGNNNSATNLVSDSNIKKLAQNLDQLPKPKILSDVVVDNNIGSKTKSDLLRDSLAFRIFGQRFSFDAWILGDLTAGQEKTDVKLPSMPSALFVPAAMGDLKAKDHVQEFLKQDAGFSPSQVQGFLTKLSQKESDIGKVKPNEWSSSFGSDWLYVLGSLTHGYDQKYPMYMQVQAFLDKQIQTFLGSYTELKHDTLLYAKQNYAERGGGPGEGDIPPVVKGFVEPNVDFWNRFNQLLYQTEIVFTKNQIFKNSGVLSRLQEFRKDVSFFTDIARKELQGNKITDDEYETLRTNSLSYMADPFDSSAADDNSGKVALIADIHTDTIQNQILYEATGKPYLMLAIVGNDQTPRAVASLVYNHYELTAPLGGQRLTDEDWRKSVYDQPNTLPVKNFWYQSLISK
jgi:hypothetical protein